MKTIHLDILGLDGATTRVFTRFPVRIGREPLNDLQLDHPFVSRLHARLEVVGEHLLLRDAGSSNGTWLLGAHDSLRAGELVDLEDVGNEFHIGTLRIRARLVEERLERRARDGASTEDRTTGYEEEGVDPLELDAVAVMDQIRASLHQASTIDASRRAHIFSSVLREFPELRAAHVPVNDGADVEPREEARLGGR